VTKVHLKFWNGVVAKLQDLVHLTINWKGLFLAWWWCLMRMTSSSWKGCWHIDIDPRRFYWT
jgi:hypothetical protein